MTAKLLTHKFASAVAEGTDPTIVGPNEWNNDHNFWLGTRVYAIGTSPDALANSDHLCWVIYNTGANIASNLPAPASGNMPLGWTCKLKNIGGGIITLTGTGGATFNGSASPIALYQGDVAEIFSQGTVDYIVLVFRAAALLGNDGRGGQLKYVSTTQLSYLPFNGGYIRLNGVLRPIPATGNGIAGLTNTGAYVNGVAAQALAASQTYLVYAFDNAGVLTADFCTGTTHGPSATPGNVGTEVKFLSGVEDPTRSLIGMVHTDASSHFLEDGAANYGVATWHNRRWRQLSGAGSGTVSGIGSTTPVAYPAWAIGIAGWGDVPPVVDMSCLAANSTGGANTFANVGLDGSTSGLIPLTPRVYGNGQTTVFQSIFGICLSGTVTEGWHTFCLVLWVSGGGGVANAQIYGQAFI